MDAEGAEMSERTHWEGCWRERTHHACAVARCEELERERDKARLYCAEVASYVCDPIYDKADNRAGIAADAEAMATGEMVARYLDIKMQTERAIRAEAARDAAIRRAEAAEKDVERLDWLDAHPRDATVRIGGDMKIAVFWGVSAAPGTTMRAAIDAARAEGA